MFKLMGKNIITILTFIKCPYLDLCASSVLLCQQVGLILFLSSQLRKEQLFKDISLPPILTSGIVKGVNMTRKYHSQILQTSQWHREEVKEQRHDIPNTTQVKQLVLSFPREMKTKKDTKYCKTKQGPITKTPNGRTTMNKQQQNYHLRTNSS